MKTSFFLLGLVLLVACNSDPRGVAHKSINETYPNFTFNKTIYSESLIRAVSNMTELDSNFLISSNTAYILDWKIDTTARWYNNDTDSILLYNLERAGLEKYAGYTSNKTSYALYIKMADEMTVDDLVLISQDSTNYRVYEFVGEMPLNELVKFGFGNYEQLQNGLKLNPFMQNASDTTNQ